MVAIHGVARDVFEQRLKECLSPTQPIRTAQFLRGREQKLEEIRRALVAPGRQIFIHGDRGVGKTSLAQTAAYEHQSASNSPVLLTCDPASNFYRIVQDMGARLLGADPMVQKTISQTKGNISFKSLLSIEMMKSVELGRIPDVRSINEAVGLIDFLARHHSNSPVVVVDEFERISEASDRMLFADLIKQLGDQSVPIRLLFCGIGSSMDELLDAHHSCYRYLTSVALERLDHNARLAIIAGACAPFDLSIDDTTRYRISIISDGFPHYVHLVMEKLLWEVLMDTETVSQVSARHYTAAIRAAVQDIEPHLRAMYEQAIRKYNDDYEEVLWAVADNHQLTRRSADVFESYQRIMKRRERNPLPRDRFNQRMNSLKGASFGAILKANRQGWYAFTENVVRGYVRLRAEEKGLELDADHPLLRSSTK